MIHKAIKKIKRNKTTEIKMKVLYKITRFYKNHLNKIDRLILIRTKVIETKFFSMILSLIHLKCLNFLMLGRV